MPSRWLVVLSWVSLGVAFGCAGLLLVDIYGRRHRQPMRVMEAVWPVTALYLGPAAVLGYRRWGRPLSSRWQRAHGHRQPPGKPPWASTAVGVSHCGAGCTLGDIVAEFAVFGLAFQYFAIAPMRGLGFRDGIVAAAKADIVSLTAFEVGLFGWMALMALVFFPAPHHLHPDSPVYWFLMQIGMALGFLTAYPVNSWLISRGIKEAM